jgi:hypothetical protein
MCSAAMIARVSWRRQGDDIEELAQAARKVMGIAARGT